MLGIGVGVVVIMMRNRLLPQPVMIMPPEPTPLPTPTSPPPPLRVYINGAVVQADVYELPAGSLINDAVHAAGGFIQEADKRFVNLAQPLADGMHIYIPTQEETEETDSPVVIAPIASPVSDGFVPASNVESDQLVNINTAGLDALESLPGIGPALAQRIIDHRNENGPFRTLEAIQDVSGIGPAIFDDIKDLISVD